MLSTTSTVHRQGLKLKFEGRMANQLRTSRVLSSEDNPKDSAPFCSALFYDIVVPPGVTRLESRRSAWTVDMIEAIV